MKEKDAVAIYLSEADSELLQHAKKYTVLSETNLIRVLIKKHLDKVAQRGVIEFQFVLDEPINKQTCKTKVIRLKEKDYEMLNSICRCTYFSVSNIVKYWIIPELKEINKRKEWDEKI